ncbi:hypothetical protein GQ607_002196 [Colletotrichum asianum]|uniref:Uncharacterized protein n=1 Tax=Colletotrichum asianum TaxID=702518 RepID=A0A8H3WRN4_9PEZI|nr:hypothetical protein GQ607_002196 [Colletotrichum asianum]
MTKAPPIAKPVILPMHRPADGRIPVRSGADRPEDDPRLTLAETQSGAVDRPISSGTHSDGYSRAFACLALEFISRNPTPSFAIMPYQVSANTSILIRRVSDRGPTPPDTAAKLSAWPSFHDLRCKGRWRLEAVVAE